MFGTQCQCATFGTHRVFYHHYLLICSTFRSWWPELGGNSVVKRDDFGQKTLSMNTSSENTLIASSDTTSRQHGTVLLSMKRFIIPSVDKMQDFAVATHFPLFDRSIFGNRFHDQTIEQTFVATRIPPQHQTTCSSRLASCAITGNREAQPSAISS